MCKYRRRKPITTEPLIPESPASLGVQKGPSYMSLSAKYGISNMTIGIPMDSPGQNEQTVEQEYQVYMTPPFALQSPDPLKFWEVGGGG